MAPVKPGVQKRWGKTGIVDRQSVTHRLYCSARAAAVVLAAGWAAFSATFLGGVAVADPVPPSPSPSTSGSPQPPATTPASTAPVPSNQLSKRLNVALSPPRGAPGTSFTATTPGVKACDPIRTAVAEPGISFVWSFGKPVSQPDEASATFTVPENAAPGPYHVIASCPGPRNVSGSADFTVTEKPSLMLSPPEGTPGQTWVTASVKGFDACLGGGSSGSQAISWRWDDGSLDTATEGGDGSTVTFVVPRNASPADKHTVTASCGRLSAPASFTVIRVATPSLKLATGQGLPGSQVTASGTGFACGDDRVDLLWDGDASLAEAPSGSFSVTLTIPATASISQHTVVAVCRNHPDMTDNQSYTVTKDTVPVTEPAILALEPARGAAGDQIGVIGDRFSCNDPRTVLLSWDGRPLSTVSADASGHFDASIAIPLDAQQSNHLVRASCSDGTPFATAGFTVVAGPVPTTIPTTQPSTSNTSSEKPGGTSGWTVLLILGVVVLGAVLAYRHLRKPRPEPTPRVYATVSPISGLPLVTTSETPAHGEVTHALRLRTHADLGSQTISEVNNDDSTQ